MATSEPGTIHLLNGLYDAKADHPPVVAIVGQRARAALGGNYQQKVEPPSLFKDVAHEYMHMATARAQIRHLADHAMRIKRDQRTVTCIILRNDLQGLNRRRTHDLAARGVGRHAQLGLLLFLTSRCLSDARCADVVGPRVWADRFFH